jgi:surface carbohydrate biosynthesis protein
MKNKIKNIKKIFIARYKYLFSSSKDIVIFDREGHEFLLPVLPGGIKYFVLESRLEVIYLNFFIITKTIYHSIICKSLIVGYFSALLDYLKPNTVITFIDNGKMFYWVSRYYKNSTFIAIQNANRYDIRHASKEKTKDVFLPIFACFGKYEVDLYNDMGATVGQFFPIGSLKNDIYKKNKSLKNKSNDICFVCEPSPGWDKIEGVGFEDALGTIASYALKYATEHGKSIHFSGKREENTLERHQEIEWYRRYIGDSADKITFNILKTFSTYELIDASSVSVGFISTSLVEGMSRGNRCLQCNFTEDEKWSFPIDGPWFLNKNDYLSFEKYMNYLFSITDEKFNNDAGEMINYMIHHDESETAVDFLKEYITNVK